MSKQIEVKLKLNDQLTAALRNATKSAESSLKNLQDKFNRLKPPNQSSGVGTSGSAKSSFVGDMVLANAISSVASGVLSAGSQLVNSIAGAFTDASKAQGANLGSASAISALMGTSLDTGLAIQEDVTRKLIDSAKRLPGSTKDYTEAFNGLSDSLTLSGGLTKSGLTQAGKDMTELTALLGKDSGVGSAAVSTVIGKMLGDTGSEALFRIDAFEKVPAFKALLEKGLAESGKTIDDFFKMDAKQKQEYLVKTKNSLYSPEYLSRMAETAQTQLDTLMSDLFDPQGGLFGFARKIKFGGSELSVVDQLAKTFRQVGSFFSSVQNLLTDLGLEFGDPMVALVSGLSSFGGFITGITQQLQKFNITSSMNGLDPGEIGGRLLGWISNTVSSLLSGLQGMISSGAQQLNNFLSTTNWNEMGYTVITKISDGLRFVMDATRNFLIANQGNMAGLVFNGFSALFQFIGGAARGLAVSIVPLAGSIILTAFTQLFTSIGVAISAIAGSAVGLVKTGLQNALSILDSVWSTISNAFSSLLEKAKSFIGLGLSNPVSTNSGNASVGNAFNGNLLDAANLENRMKPQGSKLLLANSSEMIIPRNQQSMLNNTVNISISVDQVKQIVQESMSALESSLRKSPISMIA